MEKKSPPEGQNIITTTRSHSDPKVTGAITACEPTDVIRVGGAGHKVSPYLFMEGGGGIRRYNTNWGIQEKFRVMNIEMY